MLRFVNMVLMSLGFHDDAENGFSSDNDAFHIPSVNYSHTKYLLMSLSLLSANNGVPTGKTDDKPEG